jgi:signal transduction histidine kinase/DNA-binding response OmpR family regulator
MGQAAVVGAAIGLVVLIWLGSISALRANRAEVEAHAAAETANQTLMIADRMNEHLAAIDRTLRFLEREWENNPEGFDLPAWRQRAVVLSDGALQVFITDAAGVVRQATDSAMLGADVAQRSFFRNRAALPADDGSIYIGDAVRKPDGGGWMLNIARRLDLPDGDFAGVITVRYDLGALFAYFREANLGRNGLIELVAQTDEHLLAAFGGDALPGQTIAGTALGRAIAAMPDGRWTGATPSDGVERVHAFHTLRDRGLELVLGMAVADAVRPAMRWEGQALIFTGLTTVLVLILAMALLMQARAAQRRVVALGEEQALLAAAKADADAKSQRLQVTLAGMSDGIMMMDADLRLVEWNARFPELIGVAPAMLHCGLPFADVLRAQTRAGEFGPVDVEAEVAMRIAAIRAAGESVTAERARPDGRAIAVRRRRLADGSFVTIYTDITERKRNEDALRQARLLAEATAEAKSRFVAMVSHEIRQPLNALLTSLSLLTADDMPPAGRRLVETARQSGDALRGLLNDILEMSKMEAGQLALHPDVFRLSPLLQGVLDVFAGQAASRAMVLSLAIDAGTPERLVADPTRIRQILMNLVGNAVKFASPGRIVLAAGIDPDMPTMLRLTVRDPGPAVEPSSRARLFQPFVQLGQGPADDAGTGLGLAICQTLAQLLGGEIGYQATEDGGNAFWVRLAYATPVQGPPRSAAPRPIYPRTRILLVEDIRANQLVIATMLRRDGHLVDVAASGSAAIRAVLGQPYDLVLMDIFMPGMSGIEATRQIRALPAPVGQVPICALTGNVSEDDRASCTAAGMNDILGKPVERAALTGLLGRLVWRHRPAARPGGLLEPQVDAPVLPLLMPSQLAELRRNLPAAALAELAGQAAEELAARLPSLRAALAAADSAAVLAEAHAMAGLAGSYAMALLEFRLQSIVEAARTSAAAMASLDTADLPDLLARSAAALRRAVAVAT